MKKLIMFVMVLMLCIVPAVRAADPVAFYSLSGCLEDNTGNGNDGTIAGTETYSGDVPDQGSGGESLSLDGASSVITTVDTCIFESDFTITFWFKSETDLGCAIGIGGPDQEIDEHGITIYMDSGGGLTNDVWMRAANATSGGWDDGEWHHYTLVQHYPGTQTLYIDGEVDGTGDASYSEYDCSYTGSAFVIGAHLDVTDGGVMDDLGVNPFTGLIKDVGVYDVALDFEGVEEAMDEGDYICPGPKQPLRVDPNVLDVYETGETEGNFDVYLNFPPLGQGGPGSPQGTPYTITVTIDPNGGNGGWGEGGDSDKDIQLLAGQGADNQITLNFDQNNWNVPQTILFKALDDTVAEPPELIEITDIGITITSNVAEPNLNQDLEGNPWSKNQTAEVMDNDQANILFAVSPANAEINPKDPVTGPVKIWEETAYSYGYPVIRWRKIWVTLQVPPSGGPVKLQAEVTGDIEGNNLPLTDPVLPYEEFDDPNGLIFTPGEGGNYDTPQPIKIWGNDDDVLQVDAFVEGNQYYQATLSVWVADDGGDTRFTDMERAVQFDIEDNECGAWGISYLDIGNPNAFTDPNYQDEDGNPLPDCYVDIYDTIEMASRWLNCSDPQTAGCIHYND